MTEADMRAVSHEDDRTTKKERVRLAGIVIDALALLLEQP